MATGPEPGRRHAVVALDGVERGGDGGRGGLGRACGAPPAGSAAGRGRRARAVRARRARRSSPASASRSTSTSRRSVRACQRVGSKSSAAGPSSAADARPDGDAGLDGHSAGPERVAVISCEMPVDRSVRSTDSNPAASERRQHLVGRREVGHRLGQVAVGGRRRTAARRSAGRPCRSRCRGPSAGPGWPARRPRGARCGRPGARPGRARRRTGRARPEVAQGEAAGDAVDRARRRPGGRGRRPGPGARSVRAAGEHAEGEVEADGPSPCACSSRQRSPVPQARSATTEPRPSRSVADGARAPPDVHAERHDPVHQVVPRRDRVEHRPHRRDLLVALGEGLGEGRGGGGAHPPTVRSRRPSTTR